MSLNCAEIDKVLGELPLEGSFIQNIIQPSFDAVAFYLYSGAKAGREAVPFTLFVCLAHGACRLHSFSSKIPKFEKPLRFMEFLRSRIKGARINSVSQIGTDRIVKFSLSRAGEQFFMYIRLWSGAGNIIVTDSDNRILDVFYRRPGRGEVSGGIWDYVPPEKTVPPENFKIRDFESLDSVPGGERVPAGKEETAGSGYPWPYNHAVERWYSSMGETLSRNALVEEARRRFSAKFAKLERSIEKLKAKRRDFLNADRLRRQGDLLTANLWAVKPGAFFIEVEDYEAEKPGSIVRIPLNPRLSPQENAAVFYAGYKKAVSGLEDLTGDIEAAEKNLAGLRKQLSEIEAEPNPLVIQKKLRMQAVPRTGDSKRFPGPVFRRNDWLMLVGRSATENDELLRHFVRGSDMWLHARDWPGGYVFIKNRPGKTIPLEILLDAGTLAVFYSKGRNNGSGDVYCTQVKYLRRAKGAPKGTVLPTHEKNLFIKMDSGRLKALELCREN